MLVVDLEEEGRPVVYLEDEEEMLVVDLEEEGRLVVELGAAGFVVGKGQAELDMPMDFEEGIVQVVVGFDLADEVVVVELVETGGSAVVGFLLGYFQACCMSHVGSSLAEFLRLDNSHRVVEVYHQRFLVVPQLLVHKDLDLEAVGRIEGGIEMGPGSKQELDLPLTLESVMQCYVGGNIRGVDVDSGILQIPIHPLRKRLATHVRITLLSASST
ncbi:unnamed protein product [Ilex paraguariensis]|uniref:Uncharacterized protein n=1 Tax=Ilex paraguariensis TaxID=185542 RepID=A0ABC8RXT0_9AQUA